MATHFTDLSLESYCGGRCELRRILHPTLLVSTIERIDCAERSDMSLHRFSGIEECIFLVVCMGILSTLRSMIFFDQSVPPRVRVLFSFTVS